MIRRIRWAAITYSRIAARSLACGFTIALVGVILGNDPLARIGLAGALWAFVAMMLVIPLTQLPRR